ncbi:MAG: SOS response-associated peptidase [Bacteroidia bacterium]
MCGRYTFTRALNPEEIVYPEGVVADSRPRYNIAPTQYAPVLAMSDTMHTSYFRWGLIPYWAKDISIGVRTINARAETLLEKPAFREPVRRNRCLVYADGFYEWKKTGAGKQPHFITLRDETPFYFAGIADEWLSPEGKRIPSFSIITTTPNELMADIHDRMPVILTGDSVARWMDPRATAGEAIAVLKPYESKRMKAYPVSPQVGNVRADFPGLTEPWSPPPQLF